MAQRRMFSLQIVASDTFLEMPTSARELYFQLGMYADDDGFVSPRKIMRMIGASDDDLKILLAKRFLLAFENGVVVIKDWKMNNQIKSDRYHETQYLEEKSCLITKQNGSYTELEQKWNQSGTAGKVRLVKESQDKINLEPPAKAGVSPPCLKPASDLEEKPSVANSDSELMGDGGKPDGKKLTPTAPPVPSPFSLFWEAYPKKELKKKTEEIWHRNKLNKRLPEILAFIEKAKCTDRWQKGFVKQPTTFLNGECWNDDLAAYGTSHAIKPKALQITNKYDTYDNT